MNTVNLIALGACRGAVQWAKSQPNAKTAWAKCERGDWMMWFITHITNAKPWSDERKPILAACLDCADLVAHLRAKEQAQAIAEGISVLRRWISGKASQRHAKKAVQQIREAAAFSAAYAAAHYEAAHAAYEAAYTADVSYIGLFAACEATYTAVTYAVTYAAHAAFDAFSCSGKLIRLRLAYADIIRKHFPKPPIL